MVHRENCHLAVAGAFTEPRRADTRRSCYCAFVHRKRRYFTGERSCCNQERGASAPRGMYPAHANSKRRNSSHWNCRRGLQTHGGLTPAALAKVRASQTSFFSPASFFRRTSAHQHKSGGRQPPVECTQRMRTRSAEIRRIGIADGVYKPTAGSRPPLLVLCVRASQTSFFRRQTSAHQHKSGGVSPPVAGHRPRHNEPAKHNRRWQPHPHIRLGKSGHSTPTAASRAAQVETT
jgi:hypothetical protein